MVTTVTERAPTAMKLIALSPLSAFLVSISPAIPVASVFVGIPICLALVLGEQAERQASDFME